VVVEQEDVEPPVMIEVDEGAASSHGLGDISTLGRAADVSEVDSGLRGDVDEPRKAR
jgi:hypothetical protein